jgi:hypothetical protein
MAGHRRLWQGVDIVVAWLFVVAYIYAGGVALKSFELNAEKVRAREYCVMIDKLMIDLVPAQRRQFSNMLDSMIDAGMCRAPHCKMMVLPELAIEYRVVTSLGCSDFVNYEKSSFVAAVRSSIDPTLQAKVSVRGCSATNIGGRRLGDASIKLDVIISSDTIHSMDKIVEVCRNAEYSKSFTDVLDAANTTAFAVSAIQTMGLENPAGEPIMMMDASELDSFPASMFHDPAKAPGEALDGFMAVDKTTGAAVPLAARARGATGTVRTHHKVWGCHRRQLFLTDMSVASEEEPDTAEITDGVGSSLFGHFASIVNKGCEEDDHSDGHEEMDSRAQGTKHAGRGLAENQTSPGYVIGYLGPNLESLNWEGGEFFYSLTVITTIGYGVFVPQTANGR